MTETPASRSYQEEAVDAARAPMLLLRLGDALFALDLRAADEAIEWPALDRLAEMPPTMLGVFPLRGQLVPVYTPERVLQTARAEHEGVVLVMRAAERRVGIAVDDVEDVIMIDCSRLLRPPSADADKVLLGMVRRGEELVGVVDAAALVRACALAGEGA